MIPRRIALLGFILLATLGATGAELNEAGKAAYGRGDYAGAERLFREAAEQSPDEPVFHYHRAVALTHLKRWREAADSYRTALRLQPPTLLAKQAREGLQSLEPFLRPAPARAAQRADAEGVTVPVERTAGVWTTTVVLNQTRTARFLVDTGAGITAISPDLADALDIRVPRNARWITLSTAAGPTQGPLVRLSSISVGGLEATDVAAVVHDTGMGLDGILGNTFLGRYTVVLDPRRGVLNLRPR